MKNSNSILAIFRLHKKVNKLYNKTSINKEVLINKLGVLLLAL